jgi:hypothetical protein
MKNVVYFNGVDKKTGEAWTISDRFRAGAYTRPLFGST